MSPRTSRWIGKNWRDRSSGDSAVGELSSERHTVQDPLARYAEEGGWSYLPPAEALRLRRGESSPILWDVFVEQVQKLNPGYVDHNEAKEAGKRLIRVPPTIEGNLQAWEFIKGLKTVFVPTERCAL